MASGSSVGSRDRLRQIRSGVVRRLPLPVANGLRRALRPVRIAVQEPHQLANMEATMAGAVATNEAGIVGLSQELARLAERVDDLQRSQDELSATARRQAELIDPREAPPLAEPDQP